MNVRAKNEFRGIVCEWCERKRMKITKIFERLKFYLFGNKCLFLLTSECDIDCLTGTRYELLMQPFVEFVLCRTIEIYNK
jgi:hypothetical protein